MQKTYRGRRDRENVAHVTVTDDEGTRALPPRRDLRDHSPTGFAWGYSGSGPAQLALAMCADLLGDGPRALAVYQEFKRHTVALFRMEGWEISESFALAVINRIETEQPRREVG